MKIFVSASYSAHVDYKTGEVFPEYRDWLERVLGIIERAGHTVTCALRADNYHINNQDPAAAYHLDTEYITHCDALLAVVADSVSAGVQSEIGMAVALRKHVVLAHTSSVKLGYFNDVLIKAGVAQDLEMPITSKKLNSLLQYRSASADRLQS